MTGRVPSGAWTRGRRAPSEVRAVRAQFEGINGPRHWQAAARSEHGTDARGIKAVTGIVLTVLGFAAVLHYTYLEKISPIYDYAGLAYRAPDPFNYTVAILAAVVVALMLPRRVRHTSDFILWLLFIVAGAPSILITQYALILPTDQATIVGLHVAGCLIMTRVVTAVRPRNFMPQGGVSPALFWHLLVGASALIYAYLAFINGIQLRVLDINDVYSVRSDFAEVTTGDALLGYLLPIQYGVINPLFIARGFYSRRRGYLLAGILGQALIYTTVGLKSVLFSILGIVIVGYLFRHSPRLRGIQIMRAGTLGAVGALVVDYVTSAFALTGSFTRRFLIIPGALTSAYVLIFADRPKTNFADSLLPFLSNPYTTSPTHIVGSLFVSNAGTSANVNLFGHGFLNYGFVGMYIESLVLAVLLWLIDDVTRRIPTAVTSIIFLMPAAALANASVFTTILTHGFAAGMVICAIAPRKGWATRSRTRASPAMLEERAWPGPGVIEVSPKPQGSFWGQVPLGGMDERHPA